MIFDDGVPPQDAIDFMNKVIVPAPLSSSEWQDVPVELRNRAFFSSRVENAQFLQNARDQIQDFLKNSRDENGALKTGGRAKFVNDMQGWLTANGVARAEGGLTDITSQRRLGLIFNTMIAQANGYASWKAGMDPDVLSEFPAMRFIRVFSVKEPRLNHARYQGKVFLKTDPIWYLVINSDFGVPWGPWGWGCGHDVEDVDRDEADELALGPIGDAEAMLKKFNINTGLQASVRKMDPDLVAKLKEVFGDRITIDGDNIVWAAPVPAAPIIPAPAAAVVALPPAVSDAINVAIGGAKLKDQVEMALNAIDAVHGDGVLPVIDVESTRQSSLGLFQMSMSANGMQARNILIRSSGNWPALTTVHEVGHFLDLEGIGVKGSFATLAGNADMAQVLAAAEQTSAIQGLRARLASASSLDVRRHLQYLLKPEEIWARAYAQFITEQSGSQFPALQDQLALAMKEERFRQWAGADFRPVADAIDEMFRALGWAPGGAATF